MGWTADVTEPHPDKYIICLAPHTSNWDFLIGQLYSKSQGMKSNFLMKKEWFFWPLGPIFRKLGGIPVWRSKHTSMTDNLARDCKEGANLPSVHHARRHTFAEPRMEEGLLLYCSEGRHPYPTLRCGLREASHPVHQDYHSQCAKSSCILRTSRANARRSLL